MVSLNTELRPQVDIIYISFKVTIDKKVDGTLDSVLRYRLDGTLATAFS